MLASHVINTKKARATNSSFFGNLTKYSKRNLAIIQKTHIFIVATFSFWINSFKCF